MILIEENKFPVHSVWKKRIKTDPNSENIEIVVSTSGKKIKTQIQLHQLSIQIDSVFEF